MSGGKRGVTRLRPIIYNPIRSSHLYDSNGSPSERAGRIVLGVSPFVRYKQAHILFAAFVQIADLYPDVSLVYIGRVVDQSYYSTIIASLPPCLLSRISILTEYISHDALAAAYKSAFVYVSMSLCESFGLPAIEGQSFGVPSLVLDGTAASEICGAGGLTVKDSNAQTLVQALREILDSESLHSRLSANSISNAAKYASPSVSSPMLDAIDILAKVGSLS